MPVRFDHAIVPARDPALSARFLTRLLDLPEATTWGPFTTVRLDDGTTLQYADPRIDFPPLHLAFLVGDEEFDLAHARIVAAGLPFWADPQQARHGEINTDHGGRGLYVDDPAGHHLEFLTRRYDGSA